MDVLIFEDKLGITDNYQYLWNKLLSEARLDPTQCRKAKAYIAPEFQNKKLLLRRGNRIEPTYNPDLHAELVQWMSKMIWHFEPKLLLIQDIGLLGTLGIDQEIASIDNVRGGVYTFNNLPALVTFPIHAVNTNQKPKDIKLLNNNHTSKAEFFEDDETEDDEVFVEPYTIPYGRWVLAADLRKARRLLDKIKGVTTPLGFVKQNSIELLKEGK